MKALVAAVLVMLVLAGCQAGTDQYGRGPLILSEPVIKLVESYRHGGDGIHENLVIAVDRHSRYIGGVYCPTTDIHACFDVGSLTASQAVDNCSKDGKYDCRVYSVIEKVVWQGPVFRRDRSAQQSVPYNGIWTGVIAWDAAAGESFRLVAREGKLSADGIVPAQTCGVEYRAANTREGSMWINCGGDATVRLSLAFGAQNMVDGAGKDAAGRPVTIRLDLQSGTGTEPLPSSS